MTPDDPRDWIFDDSAFPYPSEFDRERGVWIERIERDGYEHRERESVGKLIVSKALQAFGISKGKDAA